MGRCKKAQLLVDGLAAQKTGPENSHSEDEVVSVKRDQGIGSPIQQFWTANKGRAILLMAQLGKNWLPIVLTQLSP